MKLHFAITTGKSQGTKLQLSTQQCLESFWLGFAKYMLWISLVPIQILKWLICQRLEGIWKTIHDPPTFIPTFETMTTLE